MPLSKSRSLQLRRALPLEFLEAATGQLLRRPNLRSLIPSHLVMMHQMSRAAVPLMKVARQEARYRQRDRLCIVLADYYARHIEEETGHDEWFLQDLESIGIQREAVLRMAPSADIASLVGAQYYWALHHHPVALLGYIAILEGSVPTESLVDTLQAETGLPDSAFRTLRLHATVDPDHQTALDRLFDNLPLDDSHDSLIAVSAVHTGAGFARCLTDLQPWGRDLIATHL
jgi:hypothetical protein